MQINRCCKEFQDYMRTKKDSSIMIELYDDIINAINRCPFCGARLE